METLSLSIKVLVDSTNPSNPVTVTTDPPVSGRTLTRLSSWTDGVRDDLEDGEYVISVGAPEDGVQGTGPDEDTVNILRSQLYEPLSALQADAQDAYWWAELDDDALVAKLTGEIVPGLARNLGNIPTDRLKPGFLQLTSGCPLCGPIVSTLEANLGELATLEVDAYEAESRDYVLGVFDRLFGIKPKRPTGTAVLFVPGAEHRNPFATAANERLQARLAEITPRLEKAVATQLAEFASGSRSRADAIATALTENFAQS